MKNRLNYDSIIYNSTKPNIFKIIKSIQNTALRLLSWITTLDYIESYISPNMKLKKLKKQQEKRKILRSFITMKSSSQTSLHTIIFSNKYTYLYIYKYIISILNNQITNAASTILWQNLFKQNYINTKYIIERNHRNIIPWTIKTPKTNTHLAKYLKNEKNQHRMQNWIHKFE